MLNTSHPKSPQDSTIIFAYQGLSLDSTLDQSNDSAYITNNGNQQKNKKVFSISDAFIIGSTRK